MIKETEEQKKERVMIKAPDYYTWHPSGVECKTIIREFNMCVGSAMKYLWRNGHKLYKGYSRKECAIMDLKKAIQWIETEIDRLEKEK